MASLVMGYWFWFVDSAVLAILPDVKLDWFVELDFRDIDLKFPRYAIVATVNTGDRAGDGDGNAIATVFDELAQGFAPALDIEVRPIACRFERDFLFHDRDVARRAPSV